MCLKIPPLDDRVLQVLVVTVGDLWGRIGSGTKYRVSVIRRKFAEAKEWGQLETLDCGAFPDEAHCEVTATHAQTHNTCHPGVTHVIQE